jgi:uncharacterized DUF497 family protein
MKPFRWSPEKNELLKAERGVSFEQMTVAVETGSLLDVLSHPNQAKYPSQRILVIAIDGYVYLVPFVEEADHYFLKTVIPSRKATRDYLHTGGKDADL